MNGRQLYVSRKREADAGVGVWFFSHLVFFYCRKLTKQSLKVARLKMQWHVNRFHVTNPHRCKILNPRWFLVLMILNKASHWMRSKLKMSSFDWLVTMQLWIRKIVSTSCQVSNMFKRANFVAKMVHLLTMVSSNWQLTLDV